MRFVEENILLKMKLVFVILASLLILIEAKPRAIPQEDVIIVEEDPVNVEVIRDGGEIVMLPDWPLLETIPRGNFGEFTLRK